MSKIHVLHTSRVRDWAMANIPMPDPTYHLETQVRLGSRGPQYIVVSSETGDDMYVYPAAYLPRRRPMRRCGRRDAILAAVTRALRNQRGCPMALRTIGHVPS